jgi:hypothetical protein
MVWSLTLPFSPVDRTSPATAALAPVKTLKLGTSLVTRPRSERVPRPAVGVAATGAPSRATVPASRPRQREDVVEAATRVTATRDPHQARWRTRAESLGVGGRGAFESTVDGDSASRGG